MGTMVSPKWKNAMESKIIQGHSIDETLSYNAAKQWLIMYLSKVGMSFKIYNLGAGVTRITTDTETCPCCKRDL